VVRFQQWEKYMRHDHDDGREILRDGEVLRVPIYTQDDAKWQRAMDLIEVGMLKDHAERVAARDALHRPGFRTADQAAQDKREQARDKYIDRLQNAWKSPEQVADDACEAARAEVFQDAARTSQAIRDAAYRDYCHRLQNAWKTGA
jgi:hypothetical protein